MMRYNCGTSLPCLMLYITCWRMNRFHTEKMNMILVLDECKINAHETVYNEQYNTDRVPFVKTFYNVAFYMVNF